MAFTPARSLLPSVAVSPPPCSRSGPSRLAAPPPGGLPLPSVARRRHCQPRSAPSGSPGTRCRPAPGCPCSEGRRARCPPQPSCLAAGPRRAGAAGGGAAAGRRRPEPMAYSQGGGKKKVCYYYDGEWPGRLQRGFGEGAVGCRGWQPAGTRPAQRSRLGDARLRSSPVLRSGTRRFGVHCLGPAS